jgi:hypothetical protein
LIIEWKLSQVNIRGNNHYTSSRQVKRLPRSAHQRLQSIDVLRALAILLMVQICAADFWTPPGSGPDWLRDLSEVLGDLPAPVLAENYCPHSRLLLDPHNPQVLSILSDYFSNRRAFSTITRVPQQSAEGRPSSL